MGAASEKLSFEKGRPPGGGNRRNRATVVERESRGDFVGFWKGKGGGHRFGSVRFGGLFGLRLGQACWASDCGPHTISFLLLVAPAAAPSLHRRSRVRRPECVLGEEGAAAGVVVGGGGRGEERGGAGEVEGGQAMRLTQTGDGGGAGGLRPLGCVGRQESTRTYARVARPLFSSSASTSIYWCPLPRSPPRHTCVDWYSFLIWLAAAKLLSSQHMGCDLL
ncbi:uncharacterized protein LOC120668880 [Panicum virgatum]|uniref:uncharacterized protein LOC120668874 n=1 Tax=Panicum virgatum TaxID=38727 RepID=UPI0019D625EA|nr:uncharacterized protein LOC120668874 [Panicum virgatum]XP_039804608.1 uncharacterized protein LOC120668880 [Panicum virgatum]